MYISLLLDVEDIIAPEADDVARDVAQILTEEGVRATFCVVGERVRQWTARRRSDVTKALGRHDIGSHTDLHSVHPTVVEYTADADWQAGVQEAAEREAPAIEAIRSAFGRGPSCWGGPGNTWAPQVNEALAGLGVPAMVYAHTVVPGGDIHRFCGLLCYPAGRHVGDADYHDTPRWRANMERLADALRADAANGRQWVEVFLGHPSRILHEAFWDGPNFMAGARPERSQWVAPRRKTDHHLAQALANLRATVVALKGMPGVSIRTIAEMNDLANRGEAEPLTVQEQATAAPEIERRVRSMADWVILPPKTNLERIVGHTLDRLDTLQRVRLPEPGVGPP
ncbi:MAG: hypothetical protein FJX72_15330 [Armatimonadetes bacterium]|nr:hypothetical protein [Armatimonadota bacterium]